jgi:hypothetical protein
MENLQIFSLRASFRCETEAGRMSQFVRYLRFSTRVG